MCVYLDQLTFCGVKSVPCQPAYQAVAINSSEPFPEDGVAPELPVPSDWAGADAAEREQTGDPSTAGTKRSQ